VAQGLISKEENEMWSDLAILVCWIA